MEKELLYALKGKRISILVDNFTKGKRESYVGIVREVSDKWVYLDMEFSKQQRLEGIYISYDLILSIWIYKESWDSRRRATINN